MPRYRLVRTAEDAEFANELSFSLVIVTILWFAHDRGEVSARRDVYPLRVALLRAHIDADIASLAVLQINDGFHFALHARLGVRYLNVRDIKEFAKASTGHFYS